jgi:hypothetical protein
MATIILWSVVSLIFGPGLTRTVGKGPGALSPGCFYRFGGAGRRLSLGYIAVQEGPQQMLTAAQQHAIDRFAKDLLALSDDALIDTYHQTAEDLRAAQSEGSDNLSKAHAQTLATEKAMQDRFPDYRTRHKTRYP